MVITYHGDNYFKVVSGSTTILIDPTNQRAFRGADIVIFTSDAPPAAARGEFEENAPFFVFHQGEYEIKGVEITGWLNVYKIKVENIALATLGQMTKEPEPKIIANIASSDILILPGGGKPYISESVAAKIIRQTEPSIVIPSLYKSNIGAFLKEIGVSAKPQEKLVVKKKDVGKKEMKVVWLK